MNFQSIVIFNSQQQNPFWYCGRCAITELTVRHPWVAAIYPFLLYQKTCLIETNRKSRYHSILLDKFLKTQNEKRKSNIRCHSVKVPGAIDSGSPCVQRKNVYCHDNMQYKEAKKTFTIHTHSTHTHLRLPWHWIHCHNIWAHFISCSVAAF